MRFANLIKAVKRAPKGGSIDDVNVEAGEGEDEDRETVKSKKSVAAKKSKSKSKSAAKKNKKHKKKGKGKKGKVENKPSELIKDKEPKFPCCFYIPLDIAMEGFALIDMIYFTFYALFWVTFLSLEPFAGKDDRLILERLDNKTDNGLGTGQHANYRARMLEVGEAALKKLLRRSKARAKARAQIMDMDEVPNFVDFWETSTTFAPIQHSTLDKQAEARVYSRVARRFHQFGQEVDDGCGRDYFSNFLYANELDITRGLFEDVAGKAIAASMIYAFIGCMLLTTICCFRGYIASKVLIIILWYMQLVPGYLFLDAAVMSQSHRFCILQYGIHKTIRVQTALFWSLVWPLLSYKPYEIFIWANYIKKYYKNKEGKLIDESYFCPAKIEERQQKKFAQNPYSHKNDSQHHRRTIGRSRLFRHMQLQKSQELDKKKNKKSSHLSSKPLLIHHHHHQHRRSLESIKDSDSDS